MTISDVFTITITTVNSDYKQATDRYSANPTKEYINALHECFRKYSVLAYQRLCGLGDTLSMVEAFNSGRVATTPKDYYALYGIFSYLSMPHTDVNEEISTVRYLESLLQEYVADVNNLYNQSVDYSRLDEHIKEDLM